MQQLLPLPQQTPAAEYGREPREYDERPVSRSITKASHRARAPGFEQRHTGKPTTHISNPPRAIQQAVQHPRVDSLVPLRGFAFQLIDDASPRRAVAPGEEAEGHGEEYQERHAALGRQTPEEESGQSGADGGYGSHGRGGKGEALVVAQVSEKGRRDNAGDVENGEQKGG